MAFQEGMMELYPEVHAHIFLPIAYWEFPSEDWLNRVPLMILQVV